MQCLINELLSKHTYYRIGGAAKFLYIPESIDDLIELKKITIDSNLPYFFIGAGSNLLVSDTGFNGIVIKTTRLNLNINLSDHHTVETGASVHVSTLLRKASQNGWGGLEWFSGIPGTIGGVVYMNAGTHLGEAKDNLKSVDIFDFDPSIHPDHSLKTLTKNDLLYEYRKNCFLKNSHIVFSAVWSYEPQDPTLVKQKIDETLKRRKESQPLDYPSCGSVFKNPKESGFRAWEVIDKIGLRGHQIGGAQISEKHPNFILNLGNAKASDVRQLIDLVKKTALERLGVQMIEEVKYLE